MIQPNGIDWTNKSVLKFARGDNPISLMERTARELTLQARDAGWQGPPFNPIAIADLLKIPVEANADVADARTVSADGALLIQFNPTQTRERLRFSIAHEIAHTLFPDVAEEVRHRNAAHKRPDDWQLEMLCNIAAAEFVMPIGSLKAREHLPLIEALMSERQGFGVSTEAFLIRVTKICRDPVLMFCASPIVADAGDLTRYRIDYAVPSRSAPNFKLTGRVIPSGSIVNSCTAIGFTNSATETWFRRQRLRIECVGIPGYPGTSIPRVAGLVRFMGEAPIAGAIKYLHGDVLKSTGNGKQLVCQLVNDQARFWGGGVAKAAARAYPNAQRDFAGWIMSTPRSQRLGAVRFAQVSEARYIASLVAQHGYGPSLFPRIRYAALGDCLDKVATFAKEQSLSVHMPRLGSGQSGGDWATVEEIVQNTLIARGVSVVVYDPPPKPAAADLELFG